MQKFILCLVCIICLVTGCGNKNIYEQQTLDNVSINIDNVTPTGATLTIKDENENPYIYGEWYEIEKEVDSEWERLETINDLVFNDLGYKVDENNMVSFTMDWQDYYGTLEPGSYRLIKRIDNNYLYTYFTIEDES